MCYCEGVSDAETVLICSKLNFSGGIEKSAFADVLSFSCKRNCFFKVLSHLYSTFVVKKNEKLNIKKWIEWNITVHSTQWLGGLLQRGERKERGSNQTLLQTF